MFTPKRIIFEKGVLDYNIAKEILNNFKDKPGVEMLFPSSNKVKQLIPGDNLEVQYREGKKTLVLGIKKSLKFQSCKPSAHYQLPLVSGCMGQCEYCYLNTRLGDKPFVRVYVNMEDILHQTQKYISERLPEETIFEGAATSDPVPVEPYTHALEKCIEFFGQSEKGRFRFVTKYTDIKSLLGLKHNGHTEMRFSINTDYVIKEYEHSTPLRNKRIEAGIEAVNAGYPVGFLIAPVFIYPKWKEDYHSLLMELSKRLPEKLMYPVTFEVISHRYTSIAKERILQVFPETKLPMEEEDRQFKFGQFGYGKYVYSKERLKEVKDFFSEDIELLFKDKKVLYII